MTWFGLVWKNLLRRPARTALTAAGVAIGVALIVALLSITAGVHRTANDLIHVGRADFGLFQSDVTDFARSNLPDTIGAGVARTPGVSQTARIKLLVTNDTLVFGLDRREFAYRRLVVVTAPAARCSRVTTPVVTWVTRSRSPAATTRSPGLPLWATGSKTSASCCRSPTCRRSRSGRTRSRPSVSSSSSARRSRPSRAAPGALPGDRRRHRAGSGRQGRHVEQVDHLDRAGSSRCSR